MGSDLQVACVWCVIFCVFVGGGVLVSVCLPCCKSTTPKIEINERKAFLMVVSCVGVSCAPKRSPPPPQKLITNQRRKGLSCCGARKKQNQIKTEQNNHTNPQRKVGKGYVVV